MTTPSTPDVADVVETVQTLFVKRDFAGIVDTLASLTVEHVTTLLTRLPDKRRAVVYRLLPKERAITVFELLDPELQSDLIKGLQGNEVAAIFTDLEPDDRVWLLDELPSALAPRLLQGLSHKERQLTAEVLGYAKRSIGRRMTPEYISTRVDYTVKYTLERVRARLDQAETVYTLPVLDAGRKVVGVVSLRTLLGAQPDQEVREVMAAAHVVPAYEDEEVAARVCTDLRVLALPIVDKESRLVGMLTIDDAVRILEAEETEDSARQGGVEPLRRPYFATPLRRLVSTRIVWLLVLAVGATVTVQV